MHLDDYVLEEETLMKISSEWSKLRNKIGHSKYLFENSYTGRDFVYEYMHDIKIIYVFHEITLLSKWTNTT